MVTEDPPHGDLEDISGKYLAEYDHDHSGKEHRQEIAQSRIQVLIEAPQS